MIRVVAAVICVDHRYLACRRPGDKRHGGLWEFPGGKVRRNESDSQAVHRELQEELNVRATHVGRTLFQVPEPGTAFTIVFKDVRIVGTPEPLEHTAIRWATPRELIALHLAPVDAKFVQHCLLRR